MSRREPANLEDVLDLGGAMPKHEWPGVPQTMSIPELGQVLGLDRSTAYDLAKRDELPVPVIRCGKRVMVSRRAVAQLLDRQHGDVEPTAA